MADAVVSGEGVGTAERLVLGTQAAAYPLLARVVDRVLVAREVVWPREARATRLAGVRVQAIAAVRTCLAVDDAVARRHAGDAFCPPCPVALRLSVPFALVLLQQCRCLEP